MKKNTHRNLKKRHLFITLIAMAVLVCGVALLQTNAAITIDKSMVFHDQATYFLSNIEPETGEELTIRLRAEKDALKSATLQHCTANNQTFQDVAMTKSATSYDKTGKYDYWEAKVTLQDTENQMFYYRFKVTGSISTYYYYPYSGGENGTFDCVTTNSACDVSRCWKLLPGFSTPDWAKGSTWYSIMPDAFFNGDTTNDDHNSDGNYDQPWNLEHNGLSDRYGGDLQGIMDKVDYIKSLGVNGVCYNPITTVAQNGGYGTFDQNQIESTFGNGQTYSEFIQLMHDNGFRLIQDVAIFHTVRESIYYNQGNRWPLLGYAQGTSSPFYNMITNEEKWGGFVLNNASRDAKNALWAKTEAPLAKYINSSLGWGVDGYRFDCGGDIKGTDTDGNAVANQVIMAEMRNYLKNVNKDMLMISEASSDDQLNSGAWDGQWQLNVGDNLRAVTKGMSLMYMRNCLRSEHHDVLRTATLVSHNQLTTHDYYGSVYKEGNEHLINAAKLIQMTTLGSASVYFGEETNFSGRTFDTSEGGAEGFSSFNWDESTWDQEVLNYHKALIELRNSFTALKDGAIYELDSAVGDTAKTYAYGRFDENGAVVTYANINDSTVTKTVNVAALGVANGDVMTDWFTGKQYTVSNGTVTMEVPAGGTVIVTGKKHSSYVNGAHADSIGAEVMDYATVLVSGKDVTDTYLTNGKVTVGAGECAELGNLDFAGLTNFSISADFTFTATTASNDNVIGIAMGDCVYKGETYKMGGVLRPQLAGGSQANTCLVKGTGAAHFQWLKVWGGPTIKRGESQTVTMKLTYEDGRVRFFINDSLMMTWEDNINFDAYCGKVFKPMFFNYYSGSIDYALPFTLSNIRVEGVTTDNQSDTKVSSDGTVTVTRNNGTITETSDRMKFIQTPIYQNYEYEVCVDGNTSSTLAVLARNSLDKDSVYYGAKVTGTTVTVLARKTKGATPVVIQSANMGSAKYLKIVRGTDNSYALYLGTKSGSDVNYTLLSGSKTYLTMDNCNYVGVGVLSGTATFRQVSVKNTDRTLYDTFDGSVTTSLLSGMTAASGTLSDGKLVLNANQTLTTKSTDNDWTFKAKLNYTPAQESDYAGVICKQDEKSFVVAGRMKTDGEQKLFFAKSSNGKLVVEYTANDTNASADVVVQLQRIGTAYTAVYSYDGKQWYALGESIFFNLSDENPGITVNGSTSAVFDYASFGDAVNDGSSVNAPKTPGKTLNLSGGKYNGTYYLNAVSGNWENASEGWKQTASGISRLAVRNKVYDSFRAEATFMLEEGAAWAGMNFGKSAYDTDISDGYLLKYTSDGKVVLEKAGKVVASYDSESSETYARVVLECIDNRIVVYFGQQATPIMNISQAEGTFGYFSYCTNGPAHVNNYNVGSVNAVAYSAGSTGVYDDRVVVYASKSGTATVTNYLREYAYTDFIFSTELTLHGGDDSILSAAGLLLNGYVGAKETDGVYLKYASDGKLRLVENGKDLCTAYTVADAPKSIKLMIIKQNGTYRVYVDNGATPVLEYKEQVNRGGVLAFAASNSDALFEDLRVDDLGAQEDYVLHGIYRNWMLKYQETRKTFEDDFSSSKLISDDYYAYSGNWNISDGVLQAAASGSLSNGVTYVGSVYSDFEMTFKMKRSSSDTAPGFAGVSFRKLMPTDRYDTSGITAAFYTHTTSLITASNVDVSVKKQDYVFTADVWHNIRVVCRGNSFKVYSNETLLFDGTDNEYTGGYITLCSGNTSVAYDDVKIVPLDGEKVSWANDLTLKDTDTQKTGTKNSYSLLAAESTGLTMKNGDTYVFEMDICQNTSTAGNGTLSGNLFAFDLLNQAISTGKTAGIEISENEIGYWKADGSKRLDVNTGVAAVSLQAGTTYHYVVTVNAYKSIRLQILKADGKTVLYDGTVAWSRIYGLKESTEDTVFVPNLIFTDQNGSVTNVKVSHVDIGMLEVKAQSRKNTQNANLTDVRFVASVNDTYSYGEAGFVFSLKNSVPVIGGENCASRSTTTVYEKIYANNELIGTAKAGYTDYSKYMYTFGISNFSTDMQIYVRAYVKLAGSQTVVYGDVVKVHISGVNQIVKTPIVYVEGGLAKDEAESKPSYEDIADLLK